MRKTSQTIPKEDDETTATEEELDVPLLPVSSDVSYPTLICHCTWIAMISCISPPIAL